MNISRRTAALFVPVALVALAGASPASAAGGDRGVSASGTCSAGASWSLKAKHDDGRIQWEFEVDSNRVGQSWAVRVTDNGTQVFKGTRTTMAPSGSFTVSRRTANMAGSDTIVARATHMGQTCSGRVTL